jgi:hypothetical protein
MKVLPYNTQLTDLKRLFQNMEIKWTNKQKNKHHDKSGTILIAQFEK